MVHYAAALLLGLSVTHVFSQSTTAILAELPTCAQQPLIEGFAASGCAATDTACICNDNNLIESLQAAVKSACDAADQAKVMKITSQYCPGNTLLAALASSTTTTSLSTSAVASTSAHSTTATISAPGLTTTLLVGPQPTSVPVTISVPTSTTSTTTSSETTSILTDSMTMTASPTSTALTSPSTTTTNYTGTVTYSTSTMASASAVETYAGCAAGTGVARLGGIAIAIVVMSVIFAEL